MISIQDLVTPGLSSGASRVILIYIWTIIKEVMSSVRNLSRFLLPTEHTLVHLIVENILRAIFQNSLQEFQVAVEFFFW